MPFGSSEAEVAIEAAEELLSKLNGIAHTQYRNHENVKIGAVASQDVPGGPLNRYILLSPMHARMRVGTPTITVGDAVPPVPQKLIGDLLLEAADRDKDFDRAIYFYGCLPQDWRGLYMVLEAVEDGNGGEANLINRQWVANGAIKKFKATANSFKALRMHARHGSLKTGISAPTQTIEEARVMIRMLVESWGTRLSSNQSEHPRNKNDL